MARGTPAARSASRVVVCMYMRALWWNAVRGTSLARAFGRVFAASCGGRCARVDTTHDAVRDCAHLCGCTQVYVRALVELFEEHKGRYGYADRALEVL